MLSENTATQEDWKGSFFDAGKYCVGVAVKSIMKWVFMQPCTQFKLMLSLSTDRIRNQSPTQGLGGRAVLMKSEGKTENPQRIEPTSLQTFYYKFSTLFFAILDEHWQESQEAAMYCKSLWSLIAKRKESNVQRGFFVGF